MSDANISVLDEVVKVVESTLKMPSGRLDANVGFETFGIDSIIAMELITNLSRHFNVSMSPAHFTTVNTVQELAELIEQLTGGNRHTDVQDDSREAEIIEQAEIIETKSHTHSLNVRNNDRFSRRGHRRSSKGNLSAFIERKYGISVTASRNATEEEIINNLVTHHLDDLMNFYGLDKGSSVQSGQLQQQASESSEKGRSVIKQDVAIVGISCRFPGAQTSTEFWENLMNQQRSIVEIPEERWSIEKHYSEIPHVNKSSTKWAALIDDVACFDASFFNFRADEAKVMDPQERLLLQEVYKAFEDACIDVSQISGSQTGVFVGYEYSEYEHFVRNNPQLLQHSPLYSSSSPTYYLANRLSYLFDFCGPSEAINVNCASSALALYRAYYSLLTGESDVAVAAGVCLNLFVDDYIYASQYGMLSTNGMCGVFDNDANGFTRGEGIAAVVLKPLQHAKRDNDRIYAVIKTCHQNNRGKANDISEIKHESITRVLNDCYQKANLSPLSVDYIEVDGYSTKWGDSFEFEGIKNLYKVTPSGEKFCALGSVKGNIGHLEPVSGLASVIKMALSLKNKQIPATITKNSINEFIAIDHPDHPLYIADEVINLDDIRRDEGVPVRVGVNSFADSGVNVHIVLDEYIDESIAIQKSETRSKQLFVLSAKNTLRLNDYISQFIHFLSNSELSFEDIAYSSQVGRKAMEERVAIVATSTSELLAKLKKISDGRLIQKPDLLDENIYYGNAEYTANQSLVNFITKDKDSQQMQKSLKSGLWQEIALLWINGVSIPWSYAWDGKAVNKVSMPTYPFAKNRYWLGKDAEEESLPDVLVNEQPDESETISVPPRNDVERTLTRIWADILGMSAESIGVTDEFIKSGGNSLSIMKLVSSIRKTFGKSLPLDIFFTTPDIASLAEIVSAEYSRAFEIVVPLKATGSRTPIFALPGAAGNITSLMNLSNMVNSEQPVYALQSIGIDGEMEPLTSIREMAQANIEAIKKIQPDGPYRLLGHSHGGVVAFEMTKLLLEQNDKVSNLYLLDAVCPSLNTEPLIDEEVVSACNSIMANLGVEFELTLQQYLKVPEDRRIDYLYEQMSSGVIILAFHI